MPYAVDEAKMKGEGDNQLLSLDPLKPPTVQIPHQEFPRIVYKHPREPFRTIEHRNAKHELVDEEHVQTEHLTHKVSDEKELRKALAEGWVVGPYIPPALPDKDAHLYDAPKYETKNAAK